MNRIVNRLSSPARVLVSEVETFVAKPADARPLAVLRIGLATVLIAQALALWGSLGELYGALGIVQAPLMEALGSSNTPRVRWLVERVAPVGLSEARVLQSLFAVFLASLIGLLAGWQTRLMACAAWLIHLTLKTSSHVSAYGVYEFAHIALFYCMVLPVGHALSVDRWRGRVGGEPSADARLGLRILQIHLCIVYLASGVEKATGEQWGTGEAIWRALMRPDFAQFDFAWLADWPLMAKLACWSTLFIEIGYPLFIWPRWTRKSTALAAIGLHAGIAVTMGLWSFASVMIVLNVSAFLVSPRPSTKAECSREAGGLIPAKAA